MYKRSKLYPQDMREARIPRRFWSVTSAGMREPFASAVNGYIDRVDAGERKPSGGFGSLFFHGPNGLGKTSAAICLAKQLRLRLQSCLYLEGWRLRDIWIKGEETADGELISDLARTVDVLLIDDFGKEAADSKDYLSSLFESLIRTRCGELRPTVVTANQSISDMAKRGVIRDSAISVMAEDFEVIGGAGADRRMEGA